MASLADMAELPCQNIHSRLVTQCLTLSDNAVDMLTRLHIVLAARSRQHNSTRYQSSWQSGQVGADHQL